MSLLGEAAPDFDDPLGLLAACHGRMRSFCDLLERLPAWIAQHGIDTEAVAGAQRVLRYFDVAAPLHHADEEQDLFPALLEAVAGSDAVCLRQLTASLQADRRELEQHWADLRPRLLRVSDALVDHLDTEVVEAFVGRYEDHIRREEADLLPMAARLLSDAELDRIGQAMRARRQTIDGT